MNLSLSGHATMELRVLLSLKWFSFHLSELIGSPYTGYFCNLVVSWPILHEIIGLSGHVNRCFELTSFFFEKTLLLIWPYSDSSSDPWNGSYILRRQFSKMKKFTLSIKSNIMCRPLFAWRNRNYWYLTRADIVFVPILMHVRKWFLSYFYLV